MAKNSLQLYVQFLEEASAPWMVEAARKRLEDVLNPANERKRAEDLLKKLWSRYTSLFDRNLFREAAEVYADWLLLRSRL